MPGEKVALLSVSYTHLDVYKRQRVACMLREQGDVVRGSLRAKDDTDVAAVARSFGGGGHVAAAGFTLSCTLDEARRSVSYTHLDVYKRQVYGQHAST